MATPHHELEAQVLRQAAEKRAQLPERLIASFERDTQVDRAWVAEALQRAADVKAGQSQMIPGSDALARVRAGLRCVSDSCPLCARITFPAEPITALQSTTQ